MSEENSNMPAEFVPMEQMANLTDDDYMNFTQRTRLAFVHHLAKDGWPVDPKDRQTMLTALADMDRTALGNKRIGADQEINDTNKRANEIMSRVFEVGGNRNIFRRDTGGEVPEFDRTQLPEHDPVPGETEIGISTDDLDTVMSGKK